MKKIFTSCALVMSMCMSNYAADIVLATFEDGANDLLEVVDYAAMEADRFVEKPGVGDNVAKSGINNSEKCYKAINIADADWWGNFGQLDLKTPITITEDNKYLKMKVYRSIQPKNFRVAINGEHEDATSVFVGKVSEDATWKGIVVDLSAHLGTDLESIVFVFSNNWDEPRSGWDPATYMFDDISLSGDMIPPGETVISSEGFRIDFDTPSLTDQWVAKFDQLNEENSHQIVDNPSKETNESSKVLEFKKTENTSWWQGFKTDFTASLDVVTNPDNKFLHVMVYVPSEVFESTGETREQIDIQLCAKDFSGNENVDLYTLWGGDEDETEANQWIDLVMEINRISFVKELTVRFDVLMDDITGEWINSPAGTFYLDDIVINDSPDPRVVIEPSSVANTQENLEVVIKGDVNRILIDSANAEQVNIQVYDTAGKLINNTEVSGDAEIAVEKGFYLVKAQSNSKIHTQKVLVK